MPSYARSLWHIVFSTKHRRPTLVAEHRREFLAYAYGVLKGLDCFTLRINAVDDHVHLLVDIPPTLALARMVGELKTSTGRWLRDSGKFPDFDYWQEKYGAFTVSWEHKDRIVEYIRNQEEHHRREDFVAEFRRLLAEAGFTLDERDI